MVDALLDTSTLIDLLREHPPAAEWFADEDRTFGITKFVWMEVVTGCMNKQALRKATRLIERFELVSVTTQDVDWALTKLTRFYLSHSPDPFDCLIAATPARLKIPLYTLNFKHFKPLIGDLAQRPYES
jgi:predicted nucleic acid-binding protein